MEKQHENNWQQTLHHEKSKVTSKLPKYIKLLWLPLARTKMAWEIAATVQSAPIKELHHKNPKTFHAILLYVCHVHRLDSLFGGYYRKIFHSLDKQLLERSLQLYGDGFVATLFERFREEIWEIDQLTKAADVINDSLSFYASSEFQEFYQKFHSELIAHLPPSTQWQHKTPVYLATICERLASFTDLRQEYLQFLNALEDVAIRFEIFKVLYMICQHVGTKNSYENFLEFCRKYSSSTLAGKMMQVAGKLAIYENPRVFNNAMLWLGKSQLPLSLRESAFLYSNELLECHSDNHSFTLFSYDRYIQYLLDKENNLLNMESERAHYYLKKAVDFFVEV